MKKITSLFIALGALVASCSEEEGRPSLIDKVSVNDDEEVFAAAHEVVGACPHVTSLYNTTIAGVRATIQFKRANIDQEDVRVLVVDIPNLYPYDFSDNPYVLQEVTNEDGTTRDCYQPQTKPKPLAQLIARRR